MRKMSLLIGFVFILGPLPCGASTGPFYAARPSSATSAPAQRLGAAQEARASGTNEKAPERPHMNHEPKHGGTFFMALDKKHHLEGVVLPPGTFRVYIYDEYTEPLKTDEVSKVSGTVQVGDADGGPEIPLVLGKDKGALEATLGRNAKFPLTLTLLLRWPGMAPASKPELFSFAFSRFTEESSSKTVASMVNTMGTKR